MSFRAYRIGHLLLMRQPSLIHRWEPGVFETKTRFIFVDVPIRSSLKKDLPWLANSASLHQQSSGSVRFSHESDNIKDTDIPVIKQWVLVQTFK